MEDYDLTCSRVMIQDIPIVARVNLHHPPHSSFLFTFPISYSFRFANHVCQPLDLKKMLKTMTLNISGEINDHCAFNYNCNKKQIFNRKTDSLFTIWLTLAAPGQLPSRIVKRNNTHLLLIDWIVLGVVVNDKKT